MKKILLIIIVSFLSASVFSQTVDSSLNIYNKKRKSAWYKGTDVPAYKINGYRAKIVNGDTLLRGSGDPFRAEELEIYPNGTDQKAAIEAATTTSGIKMIVFGGDSTMTYTIADTVDFNGATIRFVNNAMLTSGDTVVIENAIIDASVDVQIFGTNVFLGTGVSSASGTISAKWWGAKGDGTTDDTDPLKAVARIQNQNIVLPPGTYKLTEGVKIDSTNSFDGSKGVFVDGGVDGALITIGSDSLNAGAANATQGKYYYIRIRRASQSNWADSSAITDIGLRAKNLYRSKLTIDINGFTCNAMLTGDLTGGGFTESDIYGSSTNGFKNIWYTRTGNGYFNSNIFHNISIRIDSDVNPGKRAYGFVAGTQGDAYLHNNNTVDGGSIQLNGSNRVALWLIYAYQSKYIGWRNESNGITAVIENTSEQNIIRPGFTFPGTSIIDNSTGGNNIYEDPRQQNLSSANSYTVFEWSAAGNSAAYSSDGNGVRGIGLYGSTGAPITTYAPSSYLEIYSDFIRIKQTGLSAGVEFNTENNKSFLIKHTHRDSAFGRAFITMYDENGAQLVTTAPKMESLYPTYNAAWGGGWLTGGNTAEDYFLKLPDSCKKVKIAFVGPTGNALDLKSVSIHTVGPNRNNITPITGRLENITTAAPTWAGTYEEGQKIYYATPATTGTVYWLTKTAGTNRTLTSASGSISSGSKELTVTGASIDSIYVGEYLDIDGSKYKIARKSTTKIYLSTAASGTYSGTINYYPAEFIEVKNGGTSGGGGSSKGVVIDL